MIAIGGSLGGYEALSHLLGKLPATFPLPVAVVLHRHRDSDGMLLPALLKACVLPVSEAEDKEPIVGGRIYLCPPDYHLLVDGDCLALSTDPLVNYARPSLDVLFESVAEWRGHLAVAVVLTGCGSDGAHGARRIEAGGGLVLIQDPATAEAPWMPSAALAATQAARVLTLDQIAEALIGLSVSPGTSGR